MSNQTKPLTAEILKSLLPDAMIYRGEAINLNTTTATGFYNVQNTAEGIPPKAYPYGVLRVSNTSLFLMQEYLPHQSYATLLGGYWKRVRYNSRWTDWEYYAPTTLPT